MSEKQTSNDGWFPNGLNVLPTPREAIEATGRFLANIFSQFRYESPSEHFQHPLDDVFDNPPYTEPVQGRLEI